MEISIYVGSNKRKGTVLDLMETLRTSIRVKIGREREDEKKKNEIVRGTRQTKAYSSANRAYIHSYIHKYKAQAKRIQSQNRYFSSHDARLKRGVRLSYIKIP